MEGVRRSRRLSSISKVSHPETPHSAIRRAQIWRRRQTSYALTDSDDDAAEDRTSTETEEENNENCNLMNSTKRNQRTARKSLAKAPAKPKTPSKNKSARIVSTPRREQVANKRSSAPSDDSDDESNATNMQGSSPPKQARSQDKRLQDKLISPSRLIDRLSIDEAVVEISDDTDSEKEVDPPTKETSPVYNKYQNARRALNSGETTQLPGRDKQLQELRDYFASHLSEQRSGSLYVSGQPGTGKTACLSLLLHTPEFARRLQCVYINCTSIASVGGVYKKLCSELQLRPKGVNERDYITAIQNHLRTTSRMVLIVMDEIDQLCTSRQSVLYAIFEWPALPGAKLLLVGIANSLDLTDRLLTRLNARCELKPQLMHFPPYSKQQIIDIFKARLEEGNVLDVFPPAALQLLAAKVSAVSGDVRRALDIGRRVVEIAEQQKRTGERHVDIGALDIGNELEKDIVEEPLKPVQIKQVVDVLNKVYGASQNLQEDIEESFPMQQKLMLCSLLLMLRKERHKDINMGRLHEVYRRICSKRNILALDQAEFAGLVDLVETRGILRIMRKKEPRLSKVLLQWDEEEVNGALRDKQLIASILDDTDCLGR